MTIENGVRVMAGTMILISIVLVLTVSKWWLCLTGFVGLNLLQSAFTGFCPAVNILAKMGLKPTCGVAAEQQKESSTDA